MTDPSALWFERLYARLRIPFLAGAIIFGSLPMLAALALCYAIAGLWTDFLTLSVFYITVPSVFILLSQVVSRYASRQISGLRDYSNSMSQENALISIQSIYSARNVLGLSVILLASIQPLYVLQAPSAYTLEQKLLTQFVPWVYFEIFVSSLIWTITFSMFSIYRMGGVTLKLKSFAEDRTLGLRPFASVSLRLAALMTVTFAFLSFPQVLVGVATTPVFVASGAIATFLLVLFLLPLIRFHKTLIQAKHEELSWIVPRYAKVLRRFKESDSTSLDPRLLAELAALKELQKDAHLIHTWPFDTGILLRLTAILLSVAAIILAKVIQLALHL